MPWQPYRSGKRMTASMMATRAIVMKDLTMQPPAGRQFIRHYLVSQIPVDASKKVFINQFKNLSLSLMTCHVRVCACVV